MPSTKRLTLLAKRLQFNPQNNLEPPYSLTSKIVPSLRIVVAIMAPVAAINGIIASLYSCMNRAKS